MKIQSVDAYWVHIPIPPERQHTSDFGRTTSFDATLVRITEAMRISALASAYNLKLAPHLWAGAPAFAAGLHVAAASPAGFIVEYSLGANPLLHEFVEESFPVQDGNIEIPDRPGLGITVREDFLAARTVR
jgi:L-alanine-DL-glutamate epimerase-like enolase superfamily enzyme